MWSRGRKLSSTSLLLRYFRSNCTQISPGLCLLEIIEGDQTFFLIGDLQVRCEALFQCAPSRSRQPGPFVSLRRCPQAQRFSLTCNFISVWHQTHPRLLLPPPPSASDCQAEASSACLARPSVCDHSGCSGADWCSCVGALLQVTDRPFRGMQVAPLPLINWLINPGSGIDNARFARIHAPGDTGTCPHSAAPCKTRPEVVRRKQANGGDESGMLVLKPNINTATDEAKTPPLIAVRRVTVEIYWVIDEVMLPFSII